MIFFLMSHKQLNAIEINKIDASSFGTHLVFADFYQADHELQTRFGFEFFYNHVLFEQSQKARHDTISSMIQPRISTGLKILPNEDTGTKNVQIKRDFYDFYTSLEISYTYLFRYIATVGNSLMCEYITYNIVDVSEYLFDYQYSYFFGGGIEYQLIDKIVISYKRQYAYRLKDEQAHTFHLLGISYAL